MLLVQEFDIEIKDKKGAENSVAAHLSRIKRESDPMPIQVEFPNEQLLHLNKITPWFADICNFIVASQFPPEASRLYKEKLKSDAKYYIWDDPYLWRLCNDQVIHRCIPNSVIKSVLQFCHTTFGGGSFPVSNGYSYIFLAVDYVSQWVEAIATKTNDAKVVVDFLKFNIFYRFGVSKALISDQGSHFCKRAMSSLIDKYRVLHQIGIAYHPRQMAKLKCLIGKSRKLYKR
ncbi:gag-pol, partial [Mucuna pruriens]